MNKTRFTEAQIIGILKEQEQGFKVANICWKQGISDGMFYNRKSKYAEMSVDEHPHAPTRKWLKSYKVRRLLTVSPPWDASKPAGKRIPSVY